MLCVPAVASTPLQPPEAVHEVALVELHVRVETPPRATDVGVADSLTVALPGTVIVAVAISLVPAAPVQINEYDTVAVTGPVLRLPLVPTSPLQSPEAVHEVALFELQVSVETPPLLIVVCAALSETVGRPLWVGLTVPPHAASSSSDAPTGTQ